MGDKINEWIGFLPKLASIAFTILFAAFVSYLIWLGNMVIRIDQRTTAIEAAITSLNNSRQAGNERRSESNSQRIGELEDMLP